MRKVIEICDICKKEVSVKKLVLQGAPLERGVVQLYMDVCLTCSVILLTDLLRGVSYLEREEIYNKYRKKED